MIPSVHQSICFFISQAARTEGVCEQLVDSDARALYEAGEARKGTNCAVLIDILTSRSAIHLRQGRFDSCTVKYIFFLSLIFNISFLGIAPNLYSISVFDRYKKYSKVDVAKALDLELKGDIENCLTTVGKVKPLFTKPLNSLTLALNQHILDGLD